MEDVVAALLVILAVALVIAVVRIRELNAENNRLRKDTDDA